MTPDDLMGNVKAETRSPAHHLGCKKRFEDIFQRRGGNPLARIPAHDEDGVRRRQIAGRQGNLPLSPPAAPGGRSG